MKRRFHILVILLAMVVSTASAEETMSFVCGERALVSATAQPGYHFVQWSDGVTDNPRTVTMVNDLALEAVFEPDCEQAIPVPVVRLYDWLLMLNVDSLHARGYQFAEQDVWWYRIVDGQTPTPVQQGYYLSLNQNLQGTGDYYAVVDISRTTGMNLCADHLQTERVYYSSSPQRSTERVVQLCPSYTPRGTEVTLSGLAPAQTTTIRIYSAAGQLLQEILSTGQEQISLPPQTLTGYYLVRVADEENNTCLRYFVHE